jgi:hypothetical protein
MENLDPKPRTEVVAKKKQQQEKELVGKIMPHRGHTIWQINTETMQVTPAQFTEQTFVIGQNHANREIIIVPGHSYVSALNVKNAVKKYLKGVNGSMFTGISRPLTF